MTESELLALMRKHGIGTDATMQDHIYTNVKRGYMKMQRGKCIPTELGIALATALFKYAPELIEPSVRARMEKALQSIVKEGISPKNLVAEIKAEFEKYYQALKERRDELRRALEAVINGRQEERRGHS
ncbi:MAG: DNA topoisomerase, partial [Pyrobaculum sp.]|jgi:DNA topoisomerase-1